MSPGRKKNTAPRAAAKFGNRRSDRGTGTTYTLDSTLILAKPQTPIKLLWYVNHSSPQVFGTIGEVIVQHMLTAAGYYVRKSFTLAGDLCVTDPITGEFLRVEVKTARKAKNGRWQFSLRKRGKSPGVMHTDVTHSDFVVLLQITDSARIIPYVIPAPELQGLSQLKISSADYTGKYAKYRVQLVEPVQDVQWELTPLGQTQLELLQ